MKRIVPVFFAIVLLVLFFSSSAFAASMQEKERFKKKYRCGNYLDSCGEELFVIKGDKRYGYADYAGNIVIEPQWINALMFKDDKAIVETMPNFYALIDHDGKEITTFYSKCTIIRYCGSMLLLGHYTDPAGLLVLSFTLTIFGDIKVPAAEIIRSRDFMLQWYVTVVPGTSVTFYSKNGRYACCTSPGGRSIPVCY